MKNECLRHGDISISDTLLNGTVTAGHGDMKKPLFKAVFGFMAFCVVLMVNLSSRIGAELVGAYLPSWAYSAGYILVCCLIVRIVWSFIKIWLTLWAMTNGNER